MAMQEIRISSANFPVNLRDCNWSTQSTEHHKGANEPRKALAWVDVDAEFACTQLSASHYTLREASHKSSNYSLCVVFPLRNKKNPARTHNLWGDVQLALSQTPKCEKDGEEQEVLPLLEVQEKIERRFISSGHCKKTLSQSTSKFQLELVHSKERVGENSIV